MWGRTWLVSGARAKATLPSLAGPVGHFSLKRRGSPGVSPGGTPSWACPSPNPAPSLLRAMPKASTWQERTRGFANFVDFTAQSAKAASSSVTMATLWGAPPCHGKAAAGPVVPAVCCAAVLSQGSSELSGRNTRTLFSLCAWLPPDLRFYWLWWWAEAEPEGDRHLGACPSPKRATRRPG